MQRHVGGMGRLVSAVAAALLVAGAAVAVDLAAATPAAAHGVGSNGCTGSPDSSPVPVRYDFHAACDRHDVCYDALWFGKGVYDLLNGGWTGRLACDDLFLREMRSSCRAIHGSNEPARRRCESVARAYYTVVRLVAGPWFDNPALN